MKKLLALVLALVMTLGLASISTTAAYADADKIDYPEAVDLMSGVGVLKGDGTNFDPDSNLTRAQAAKIIAYLAVGEDAAEAVAGSGTVFPDVPAGQWYTGYVEYCAASGYIAGATDGKFYPNDNVTTAQFAVMLLRVLGYKDAEEGLTTAFVVNTTRLATKVGLFSGNSAAAPTGNVSREEAALYAFNALKANQVEYVGGINVSTGDVTVTADSNRTYTGVALGTELYGLEVRTTTGGALGANPYGTFNTGANTVEGVIRTNSANAAVKTTTIGTTAYKIETGKELLGHYVKLYLNDVTNRTVYSLTDLTEKTVTVTNTPNTAAKLKKVFGDTLPALAAGFVDGATFDGATNTTYDAAANANNGAYNFYDDEIVSFVPPATVIASKVNAITTTAGSESITFNVVGALNNNKTNDVINEYAGIAKGDIVVLEKMNTIYTATKATTADGTLTKIEGGTKYTLNGTAYAASAATDNSGITDAAPIALAGVYRVYLDNSGKYFAITEVPGEETPTTLVYVVTTYSTTAADQYGTNTTKYFAQVVEMDGTAKNVQIKKADDGKAAGLYEIAVENDKDAGNGNLKADYASFTAVAAATAVTDKVSANSTNTDLTTSLTKVTESGNNYYLNNAQKVLYITGNKASLSVKTATGLIKNDTNGIILYGTGNDKDSNYTVKYVIVPGAAQTEDATSDDIIFAWEGGASTTKTLGKDNSTNVWEHTAYVKGAETAVTTTTAASLDGYYTYSVNGTTGAYTFTAYTGSGRTIYTDQAITNIYNNLISVGSKNDVDFSKAVIVNLTDEDISSVSDLVVGDQICCIIVNSSNKLAQNYVFVTTAVAR